MEWTGFVPVGELPHQLNPEAGFVATANHKMIPQGYPYKVGYEWAASYRHDRIAEVLSQARDGGQKLDLDDMARLQNDRDGFPS